MIDEQYLIVTTYSGKLICSSKLINQLMIDKLTEFFSALS